MKIFTIIVLLVLSLTYTSIPVEQEEQLVRPIVSASLENYTVYISIKGSIKNMGDKPVPVNETDLLIFDYPLNTSDQKVLDVKATVNDVEEKYIVYYRNGSAILVINSTLMNKTLDPGEEASAGVEYYVSVNKAMRMNSILDFYLVSDPYTLIGKAGTWNDLKSMANKTTIGVTKLWNYTHPLIKLLNKYINRTYAYTKPFDYLLDVLEWFNKNLIYATRVPPRHPWEVLVEGSGDCDDQSNLLITLLRSNGIPSYLEVGIVFLNKNYREHHTEAEGYLEYNMNGGGAHGWVATYIPPWGWIRVDPVVGSLGPLSKVAIKYALYYLQPTIVTGKIFRQDYVSGSARAVEEIKTTKLKIVVNLTVNTI